ncbi:MetQ/NlpA family ABC transporter substrate-binding protein [Gracilibacillus dipsosauri]|uniref:Lipoprotein n=1 Tax=Gracilibacillus dipsosauri TaxID=178340 RepID=A0A317KUA2_9BACI|nr:MetQ/NlpA family ABC transporter substrate-binding protein [Gracilibacillus dipsosauri]PWU66906.1 methionine ABC transporter substrate-binding protein [Gracilibacillus dipsosauri]
MKKLLALLFTASVLIVLAACGTSENEDASNEEGNQETTSITVGATSVPHAEVLEKAAPILKEEGIELKVEAYQEYTFLNEDLNNGTLDANYFQHIPYFEQQKEEFDFDIVNLGGIHIEPMGIYSKNINNIDDIPEGTTFIMSRNVPDHGRILALLEKEGLIKIDENVDKQSATVDDIVENPLNLEFDASIDPGFLPEFYEREKDAILAINTNYALEAGLVPTEDALILEGSESPYVNIIAARSEDENNEALAKLVEVLRSDEIQEFIEEEYNGSVVPVSE